MTLLFQSPLLLGLLALALVPALVHLLSRSRPREMIFPHVRFLKMIQRQTARVKTPRDRWLLLLRTLALLCLAAAFSMPFLVGKNAALPGEDSTVLILMDRSASMAAREEAGSRLEVASTLAEKYLSDTKPTQANLIWIDSQPSALFPAPGPNIDHLTNQLKRAQALPEADNLPAAMEIVLQQLALSKGHRELVIFSDFPAASWKNFQPALPPDVKVTLQRVATTAPPNVAVTQLLATPAQPVVGQEVTALVRVRNFSNEAVRSQLTLDAAGARQSQATEIPAWGESEAAFTIRPARAGQLALSTSLAPDGFPADNARHAVIVVKESLLLLTDAAPDHAETQLLKKAARALAWMEVDAVQSQRAADFVFLTAWDGKDVAPLRDLTAQGATVLLRPAPTCPLAALAELLQTTPDALGAAALDVSPTGWKILPNENHAANQLFKSGDFGNPYAGTFRERLKLPAPWCDLANARTLARYADGIPAALAFSHGKGTIILWNIPLDPAKSDWSAQSSFLPAWGEIFLHHLPQNAQSQPPVLAGSLLSWTSNDPSLSGAVTLLDPTEQAVEISESTTQEGTRWIAKDRALPGLYHWQSSQQDVHLSAVHFPESESDLRGISEDPAFAVIQQSSGSLARQAALARGIILWPWLALAAVLFLALESLIQFRSPQPNAA